jgi:hypothetical protein
MVVIYEKILSETTSEVRYVVKEFKKPEEARTYAEQRVEALTRQGYSCKFQKNGEVELYNEKARKFRILAIANKARFAPMSELEAMMAKESEESLTDLLRKIGWDWETIGRKKV